MTPIKMILNFKKQTFTSAIYIDLVGDMTLKKDW